MSQLDCQRFESRLPVPLACLYDLRKVSDKQGKAAQRVDQVVQGGPCNGDTIMSGGAPPQLILHRARAQHIRTCHVCYIQGCALTRVVKVP
jgi:hypothetical protein